MGRRSLAGSRRAAPVHGAVLDGEELLGELSTHLTEPTLPRSRALHTPSLSPPWLWAMLICCETLTFLSKQVTVQTQRANAGGAPNRSPHSMHTRAVPSPGSRSPHRSEYFRHGATMHQLVPALLWWPRRNLFSAETFFIFLFFNFFLPFFLESVPQGEDAELPQVGGIWSPQCFQAESFASGAFCLRRVPPTR